MTSRNLKPSPALAVALVALVLAAGGTALAGPSGLNRAVTKSQVKAIAEKAVESRAPVFAQIDANGFINPETADGISQKNVLLGSFGGYYCIRKLPFTPTGGFATMDLNQTGVGDLDSLAIVGLGADPSCPANTQLTVDIRDPDGGGSRAGGFFLTIYR